MRGTPAPTTPGLFLQFVRKYWAGILVVFITLFGLALRLYQLDYQCLNVDEFTSYNIANHTASYIVNYAWNMGDTIGGVQLGGDYNPPTYYLLVHYSMQLLGGFSRFAVRIPAVIFGTLCIPVIYFVGKELHNKTLGLLAATLVSFMFPFYVYSQDARPYSLVMLAFLLFTYCFIRAWRGDSSDYTAVGLAVFAALCFYSHYYSLIPVGLAFLLLLLKRPLISCFGMLNAAVLMTPMLILFNFKQVLTRQSPLQFGVGWYGPGQYAEYMANELLCWSWVILVPLFIYSVWKCGKKEPLLKVLLFIALVAVLAGIPLTHFTAIVPRYALLVAPLLLLVALYPVAEWVDNQPTRAKAITLFLSFAFLIFLFNFGSLYSWNTFNYCPYMSGTGAELPM